LPKSSTRAGQRACFIASQQRRHVLVIGTGAAGLRAAIAAHQAGSEVVVIGKRACWAAKRQARLAGLGFADVKEYLRVRRLEQGWSLRRILAELEVGSAWLKGQMNQLHIR
jgi:glycine/D-amino acid oxidase-like deaminating enzyme